MQRLILLRRIHHHSRPATPGDPLRHTFERRIDVGTEAVFCVLQGPGCFHSLSEFSRIICLDYLSGQLRCRTFPSPNGCPSAYWLIWTEEWTLIARQLENDGYLVFKTVSGEKSLQILPEEVA